MVQMANSVKYTITIKKKEGFKVRKKVETTFLTLNPFLNSWYSANQQDWSDPSNFPLSSHTVEGEKVTVLLQVNRRLHRLLVEPREVDHVELDEFLVRGDQT